ncbi:MAG: CDP-alcohol phosphatidyltransferase family protein [Candidatus Omnitrophota bacterium]|jgi:CDP-diacylglycerol--glycerol-3-phosphate 3-phosphatidyltransferase|nr:MAG: CDP-alcohol phosphatidyltransferase family protein [Candidatus Omnitrophota bacterium]
MPYQSLKRVLNFPNLLSCLRLVLGPVLAVLFFLPGRIIPYLILGLVIFCELTDWIDGYIARRRGEATDFGKILDPLADTIYRSTVFLCFAIHRYISIFLVLPVLYRDFIVSTIRTVCAYKNIQFDAGKRERPKAFIQAIVIVSILCMHSFAPRDSDLYESVYLISNILMGIACLETVYSTIDYLMEVVPTILKSDKK